MLYPFPVVFWSSSSSLVHEIGLSNFVLQAFGVEARPEQKKHQGSHSTAPKQPLMLLQILLQGCSVECSI
jgi:hypothetical protein